MQYAELAGMGENGVQMMQEVYDGKMSPEKFFEAYNAIYASGKRGGDVRSRYVALLGENVAAMARNAGEMDALKGAKSATAYKAGERAAKDPSSVSGADTTGDVAVATESVFSPQGEASGVTKEFKGSVTGKTYSAEAARLLSKAKIGALDTNKSYYKLDDLGIPKEEQQAWIDAGIAKERPIRGQTVVTVNTTVLKDEVKRREFSSQKVLQNSGGSGTIESTQSRRENSDGKESGKEENERSDRRTEGGTDKIQSGTRTQNGNGSRVQGKVGGTSQKAGKILGTSNEGLHRVESNSNAIPFNSNEIYEITNNDIFYGHQQKVVNEYGVDCFVIKKAAWEKLNLDGPAGAYKGKVYVSEDISSELLLTTAPHEGTHIMKQLKYQPYLDFIDKTPEMLDFSSNETARLLGWICDHVGVDYLSMNAAEATRLYDEMNAGIYGFYKAGMFESEGLSEWVPNAFYNFDAYITELDAIHEQYKQEVKAKRDSSGTHPTDVSADPDVQQAKSDQASSSEWSAERIEGGKAEKARPVSEIIEQIRHDFGINITKGHVRGKGVLGQYSKRNHGIRTKIANDLPTVAHELGHALDQRYGLTDKSKLTKEMRSELVNALGDLKDSYKQNLWVSEGFAEYLRRFLQNRDDAARMYPEFTRHFLNSLSKADRVLIDTFADEINAYYALDGDTATSSIRLREEGVPDARTPLEKARDMGDRVYQAWVDANHGIRLFDEATGANTYKLASNAAYSDAIAGQIITGDLTDANGQYVAPGLKAALEGVNIGDKKIYREFGEYLVLRHGPERLNEGMRIFADERKNNAAFMEKRAGELEAAHPEFKEAADRLYEFQKQFLQTWAIDTGLLPSEVAEEWAKRWSFYVPLNRAVGKAGTVGAKRGYANQNSTVRKAIGSGLDIVHPVDNIINNIVKMVNAGVRNNVMLEITAQAKAVGADATFLEEVPTPMKKKTADLTGVKAKLHDAFGAAGIGELLAEVEGESETQARNSGKSEQNIPLTDADLDDYIKTGKRLHTRNKKQRMLANGKNPILTSETATKSFINDAIHGKAGGEVRAFGKVGKRLATLISAARRTLDLNGKYIEINADDIREAYKRHSSPKEKGDIPLTDNDFENIPEYLNDIDGVLSVNTYNEKVEIHLFKELEDGYVRILTVSSLERESLQVTKLIGVSKDKFDSKYGTKKERDTGSLRGQTDKTELPNPSTKAQHTAGALSTNSIPQVKENVNKKNSTNSENKKSDAWSKVDEIIESAIDDVLIQYGQGKAHGDVVTVLRDGKQEFWKINDALLLESLTNLSQKKMNGIMEAYAVVSRFMTSNITGNNIIWSIFSNFPRDMMTFFTYSKQKNPLKSFSAMGEAYLNKVTGGNAETKNLPYIKEYHALGGGQTSAYTADVDLAKRARKKLNVLRTCQR